MNKFNSLTKLKNFFSKINFLKKMKLWQKILLLGVLPTSLAVGGVLTFVWSVFWYAPVTPETERAKAKNAHIFIEGNTIYSYSTDYEYEIDVKFQYKKDKNKSNNQGLSFKVKPDKNGYGQALGIDVAADVSNIEIDVRETKKVNIDPKSKADSRKLKNYNIKAHRKSDSGAAWISGGSGVSVSSEKMIKDTKQFKDLNAYIIDTNILDPNKNNSKTTPEYLKANFVKAIFTKKTMEQVLSNLSNSGLSGEIGNIQEIIAKGYWDKPENDPMKLSESKDSKFKYSADVEPWKLHPHAVFWHATAEKSFKSLKSQVAGIEPNVMKEVSSFTYKKGNKTYHAWLIKSNMGTSRDIGVKYGLLLSKNGFSYAGIAINGKKWVKDLNISSSPANDILGVYTVMVLDGTTQDDVDVANEISSKIGGVN